ncbi:MAG: ATP-binding protein [Pseudomonadota bacterium]
MDITVLQTVLDAVPSPTLLVGQGQKVRLANESARALFGAEIAGRPCTSFLRHPGLLDGLDAVLAGGNRVTVRLPFNGPTGESLLRAHITPQDLGAGAGGALVIFEDLTPLEQAESMRRDFVANVSHELRTPLTALVGFIETLRGAAREDAAARERFLAIMEREAGRMIRLVNDLLSLSRVEAEERRRPSEPVDVVAVLRGALATQRQQDSAAGVRLALEGAPGPLIVPGDADQLTQVFHNLIENALKYGASGGSVTVRVSQLAHEPVLRGPAVLVEVIDRGEGIEAIHIPRLTERFYRVDAHRSREKGGTGLGLAIVKHIVARHRGRLKIESAIGKGCNFMVMLPLS